MDITREEIERRMIAGKKRQIESFNRLNQFVRKGQIVFAGSSLMEGFPINEFLMDAGIPLAIYNRGIGGYTTSELLDTLGPCILDLEPSHLFINIGTNDQNGPDYKKEELMDRYARILEQVRARLPEIKLWLMAYYPVNPNVANGMMKEMLRYRTNERVRDANEGVKELAERFGATYLDLNAGITDADGNLKAEYTIEGMHMYPVGYWQVFQAMLPTLRALAEEMKP